MVKVVYRINWIPAYHIFSALASQMGRVMSEKARDAGKMFDKYMRLSPTHIRVRAQIQRVKGKVF